MTNNENEMEASSNAVSKITASFIENKKKTDLKELIDSDLQKRIHSAVLKIAKSIKHKRSRRLIADRKGVKLDLRKIVVNHYLMKVILLNCIKKVSLKSR